MYEIEQRNKRGMRRKKKKEIWFIIYWRENFVTIERVGSIRGRKVIGGKGSRLCFVWLLQP